MAFYQTANIQPLNPGNPVLSLNQKIDYLKSGFQQPSSIPSLTNVTGGAHTYTAAELLNRYTIRSALTSNPVTDTMPTAAQIIATLNNYQTNYQHSYLTRGTPINTGFYFDWTLINNDTTNILIVNGGSGVTFLNVASLTVYQSSYVVLRITVTNITTPTVSISTLSNAASGGSGTVPSGTFWGDYLYWNPNLGGGQWVVGSPNVTLGRNAGQTNQGSNAVAVGASAGQTNQGTQAIAVGSNAGSSAQGSNAVAIGSSAGRVSQGSNAIAIGALAGQTNQNSNSIVINASGSVLNSDNTGALYINPIRNSSGTSNQFSSLYYNLTNSEVSYLPNEYVNVKTYGAVGNGVTDDTTAIQNAINANPGKVIFFPQGTYIVSSTLTITSDNTLLVGTGYDTSIIKQNSNNITTVYFSPPNITTSFTVNNGIMNLQIIYANPASQTNINNAGVWLRRQSKFLINNVLISNSAQPFKSTGCVGIYATFLSISDAFTVPFTSGSSILYFENDVYLSGASYKTTIPGVCSFTNCTFAGGRIGAGLVAPYFTKEYAVILKLCDGMRFTNCYFGNVDNHVWANPGKTVDPNGVVIPDYVAFCAFGECYFDSTGAGAYWISQRSLICSLADPLGAVNDVHYSNCYFNVDRNVIYIDGCNPQIQMVNSKLNYFNDTSPTTRRYTDFCFIKAINTDICSIHVCNSYFNAYNAVTDPGLGQGVDITGSGIPSLLLTGNNFRSSDIPASSSCCLVKCSGNIGNVNITNNQHTTLTGSIQDLSFGVGTVISDFYSAANTSTSTILNGSWEQIRTPNSYIAIGSNAGLNTQGVLAVAIGANAGSTGQNQNSVAVGAFAGQSNQSSNSTAVGLYSGQTGQGQSCVAVGALAGQSNQNQQSVAVGSSAGLNSQGTGSVSIGSSAGQSNQGSNAVAVGINSGQTGQNNSAISIGVNSGQSNQGLQSVAVGQNAGQTGQGSNSVAIGSGAGLSNQGAFSIAVGQNAAATGQGANSVCIGISAGASNQGGTSVSIGYLAGQNTQGVNSIALGGSAGQTNQAAGCIAIGFNSSASTQGGTAVSIGFYGGGPGAQNNQGVQAVSIGRQAGTSTQGAAAVAIGNEAGSTYQGASAVAIGCNAGQITQGISSIAIGLTSGQDNQGSNSIAIGCNAGSTGQGVGSIAIGRLAGQTNQAANSIVICASGTAVNGTTASATYIAPIRNVTFTNVLGYDTTNFEVVYSAKTFVIDHPKDDNKYLVHSCLEGPEAGVYYRGKAHITNGQCVEVELPDYVEKLATDLTVQVTPVYSSGRTDLQSYGYYVTDIENGKFKIYGHNGTFNWVVYGKRQSIEVEPSKDLYELRGDGPYTYLRKK